MSEPVAPPANARRRQSASNLQIPLMRTSEIQRQTNETKIHLRINLDGQGVAEVNTGIGFLDHMLDLFARHAAMDLMVRAEGDLHVDHHHTTEDVGICLGQAVLSAVGDKTGIRRYGDMTLPMDETLASTAIDLGGRSFLVFHAPMPSPKIGLFDSELIEEFWRAFSNNALCNLHLQVHYGSNTHHIAEALFKAAARALRIAVESDPRMPGLPSTKGRL